MFDLLFNITDWLRTTFLLDFSFWITETSLSLFMVENFWVLPITQVLHILSIGAAFGAVLMLTLRVHGKAGTALPVNVIADRYVPWIWWGLVGILVSGLLMLAAEPLRNMINAVFWFKMGFLLITVLLTLKFQKSVGAKARAAGTDYVVSSGTRANALLLIALWCLIMVCGRWIAYVPV